MRSNGSLVAHHIGGRTGSRAFPYVPCFEKDLINVLYDADPDCLDQIRERNTHMQSRLIVLPYCLGGSNAKTSFHMALDPYMSSLYEINPAYADYYTLNSDSNLDYIHGEVGRTAEIRQIDMVTMDDILWQDDNPAPLPDFLSIDVQGAEYDILTGARRTLKSSVLGLTLEVSFHELYKNQRLFGDLTRMLHEQGFLFVAFTDRIHASPNREPVGLRAEEFLIAADALFLRDVNTIKDADPAKSVLMLRKLAYISTAFHRLEYAFNCLRMSRAQASAHNIQIPSDSGYLRFLTELEDAACRMPAIYPETFAERYPTFEASKARFDAADKPPAGFYTRIKDAFGQSYPDELIALWKTKLSVTDFITTLPLRLSASPVEKALKRHGMRRLARKVKQRRLNETRLCKLK